MTTQSWHKLYPHGVPAEIDLNGLASIAVTLEQACEQFADKPAMSCLGTTFTYRQLNEMANHFAGYLQQVAGIKEGDRVAIMLPNIHQFPICFFAAQKIGAVCVNTNPLYSSREMQYQFKDSGAKAIVIVDIFLDKLEKIIAHTDIKTVVSVGIGDLLPTWKRQLLSIVMQLKGVLPRHRLRVTKFKEAIALGKHKPHQTAKLTSDDLAVLQYTGGTTGTSKGAMLTHGNLLANMRQIQAIMKEYMTEGSETVLTALPLYHIFALTVNFLAVVNLGEHMILVPKPIPIKNTAKAFKKYPISVVTGVNTLFNALNNNKLFRRISPRSIKLAIGGGMAMQEPVARAFEEITGVLIREGYGLTEASPVTHLNPLTGENPKGAIGLPVPSTEAKIVDDNGKEMPVGQPGELVIKGPQVMKGYWQRQFETAQVLKDGWLWTGDIAKRDEEGYFYIVDRKKDMILVSGFNVYPNEVEAVLASHPKVLEVAVVGVSDPEGGETVKAFVVPKDHSLTIEDLEAFCQDQLTRYKQPRQWEFRKELPKTNVGKILRRELRA